MLQPSNRRHSAHIAKSLANKMPVSPAIPALFYHAIRDQVRMVAPWHGFAAQNRKQISFAHV